MFNNIIESCIEILNNPLLNRIASIIISFLFPLLVLLFVLRLSRDIYIVFRYTGYNKKVDNIENISDEQEIIKESDYNPIEWK